MLTSHRSPDWRRPPRPRWRPCFATRPRPLAAALARPERVVRNVWNGTRCHCAVPPRGRRPGATARARPRESGSATLCLTEIGGRLIDAVRARDPHAAGELLEVAARERALRDEVRTFTWYLSLGDLRAECEGGRERSAEREKNDDDDENDGNGDDSDR